MKYLNTDIRPMTVLDLPEVMEIENLCFKHPWKESDILYELNDNPVSNVWVIELSAPSLGIKGVCGFIDYWNTFDSGTLCQIAINPELQHLGLGSELIEEMKKDAFAKRVKTITLEVRESNEKAINFYKKHGFKVSHVKEQYYVDCENAIYMILEVNING